MILFIYITESILYIRNISKQKVITKVILTQMKKKEPYKDLIPQTRYSKSKNYN